MKKTPADVMREIRENAQRQSARIAWWDKRREDRRDERELRIEIHSETGQPDECKIWQGERLIFDGVDRSALLEQGPTAGA